LSLPDSINEAMETSIAHLADSMRYKVLEAATHRTIIVTCWNDNDPNRKAVARYLVGLRACAIDAALNIRAQVEDTPEDRSEIMQSVVDIVGESNDELTIDQKQDERNPWIAEGIWHLCMAIAKRRSDIHPMGNIIALNPIHVVSKDRGLDVIAIYMEEEAIFGLSFIESKAYKNNPNSAINDAVALFKSVDQGKYATRIRQAVQVMRASLPANTQATISTSFWKRKRSYIPNPHYDESHEINWAKTRPSFRSLEPDRANILVMPHIICGFDEFFNNIANEMRSFVRSL